MNKHAKAQSFLSLLLCALLLCGCGTSRQPSYAEDLNKAWTTHLGVPAGELLRQTDWISAGSSVSDWIAMGFSLGNVSEDYEGYLQQLQAYVEDCYEKQGGLDSVKATEYHRIALTVLALGADPTRFGKDGSGNTINLIADGTYAFSGELGKQGLNGWIWALITLDAGAYEIPGNTKYTREDILEQILSAQEESGGFGLSKGRADVDITAMALQALAPYRESCDTQIQKALAYLESVMTEDCNFQSYGAKNAESLAQVIIALCALQIDPAKDPRFCKNGHTLMQSLEAFRLSDGTYTHTLDDPYSDMMASEQVLLAQLAYNRLQDGDGRLYNFTKK